MASKKQGKSANGRVIKRPGKVTVASANYARNSHPGQTWGRVLAAGVSSFQSTPAG